MEELAHFTVVSFHIFLILFIIVGWAILPKKLLIPYIISIWAIPVGWAIYNDCIVTSAEYELSPPTNPEKTFMSKIGSGLGVDVTPMQATGIGLFIAGFVTFLASRRLMVP